MVTAVSFDAKGEMQALPAMIIATAALATWPGVAAGQLRSAWFYLSTEDHRWCSVTKERDARSAATSEALASGQSAWLRYSPAGLDSAVFTTQSEDAYTEDTYRFGPGNRLLSVQRRGHYGDDPFLAVTFVPDKAGQLHLTRRSEVMLTEQKRGGHETYFAEWPVYRGLNGLPFARLISTQPSVAVSQPCSAKLLNGS